MNIKKTLQNTNKFLLKHLKLLTIFFSFLIVLGIGIFLYFNFYQTIISAKQIIVLQSDIAPATINIKLLDQVEAKYQEKIKPTNYKWERFTNIFATNQTNSSPNNFTPSNINPQISF